MSESRLRLGVNIDHVATLRQVRGTDYPDTVEAGLVCERAGAHGITVHLREDRRHIQDADVYRLKNALNIPLNLEMAIAEPILSVAIEVQPAEACLVPEKREELTTEGGLDVAGQRDAVADAVSRLIAADIVPSLFIDPEESQVRAAADVGAPVVELHTGTYCNAFSENHPDTAAAEMERLIKAARLAAELGITVNAGHGLNLDNIGELVARVPHMDTLNIGHSIVAHAVFVGLAQAVTDMLTEMAAYAGGEHA